MCVGVCVWGGILSVYLMCAAAAAAGPGAQLAFCNRSSSSARARARRRSATWVAPKSETPRPDAPLAQARATSGPEPYRAQVQVAHACRAVPTVCHLPRCLRVIGGDGGQRRCRVGVDEALRRRRGACSGTEACLRRAPYHAVCIPYSSGVRRAACGVRRAACGVRRAACGVGGAPAPPIQLTAWGEERGASQPRGGKQPQLTLLAMPKHTRPKMRSGGCTGPAIGARLGVSPPPRSKEGWGCGLWKRCGPREDRHHSSEARRGVGTGLGRGVGHGPGPGKRGGARAWEEGGEGEAARGVARGAARPWLHRGTEAAWQA